MSSSMARSPLKAVRQRNSTTTSLCGSFISGCDAHSEPGGRAMKRWRTPVTLFPVLLAGLALSGAIAVTAQAVEPIKIGFGMGLTGGLAANGKAALLAMKIWEEEINAKGGLLGRPAQLMS